MRVIIAGCRDIYDYSIVLEAIKESNFSITTVISGGANGVDLLGERYAKENTIEVKRFPADWNTYNKAAGPIRNREMANNADALIAIWDGISKGTKDMIHTAKNNKLTIYIKKINR